MSLLLRSLIRDPRPVSRLVRRLEDEFLDEWPARKMRRTLPDYEPLAVMDDFGRQMANTLNRVHDMVEDLETLEDWASRHFDEPVKQLRRHKLEALVKRTESGGLQLALDMADYKPEDLKIRLVDDHLVVEAEHESSGEDSYRKSHFKRWFRLPQDVKVDEIKSKLTDGNRLLIDLPLNKPIESNSRTIPIEVEKKQANTKENGDQQQQQENQHHNQEERSRGSAASSG